MKTFLDCVPCFMSQALRAGRMATDNDKLIKEVLDEVGSMISEIPLEHTPPETGDRIYQKVRQITGVEDPYHSKKKVHIKEALALYPELREMIQRSKNRLLMAVRLAIAGNVIDLGVGRSYNLKEEIGRITESEFALFDFNTFCEDLSRARNILYLGDNAGESVFDRILIEELGKPVTYAVRDRAVINDVTFQDAIDSGIGEIAEIISTGSSAPGVILKLCSPCFLEHFHSADMVISKGQGNYEGLSGSSRPVFFLLMAKCQVIARDLGIKVNDIVLLRNLSF